MASNIRGATAVVGIGQTQWYRRGTAPESENKLALRAVVAAAEDAGLDPRDIDGFVSYGFEVNSGSLMSPALNTRDIRFGALVWGQQGGIAAALGLAAGAIVAGQANIVVVHRAMKDPHREPRVRVMVGLSRGFVMKPPTEVESLRVRMTEGVGAHRLSTQEVINGIQTPVMGQAVVASHMVEADGVALDAVRAFVLASHHHARHNPAALQSQVNVDPGSYQESPIISEPLRAVDRAIDADGATAVILVAANRAKDYRQKAAYLLSAPMGRYGGTDRRGYFGRDQAGRTSAGFASVAKRLWDESGFGHGDVDVAQVAVTSAAAAIPAIIEHGFCTYENVNEFMRFENLIAPDGTLPINTAGGDLAEGFIDGMGNVPEAVRQIRGTSPNQVPGAKLSLLTSVPYDGLLSSALLGSEETL